MATTRGKQQRLIESEADVAAGLRALRRKCPHMRRMHDAAGDPPLRRSFSGFPGLARIIVGQQLSVASAGAIWTRLEAAAAPVSPRTLLALDEPGMKAIGLSRGKMRTLRALSEAVAAGLDIEGLAAAEDAAVHERLTAVSGIGPWTADIYLLFCLGRADAFAPGDLALQIAVEMGLGLETRPSAKELSEIAERWRPWRGVAARVLWSYYTVAKAQRSGAPV
jgi:DNA-3-methyladenine glycosylase II